MSGCDFCLYGYEDYDGAWEFYESKGVVRSRKPHVCYECREPIPVGSSYHRFSGKWDGTITDFHFCLDCWEIGESFECSGGRSFGDLWEQIEAYLFPEMNTACLEKLTTASSKEKLMSRWRAWKFKEG